MGERAQVRGSPTPGFQQDPAEPPASPPTWGAPGGGSEPEAEALGQVAPACCLHRGPTSAAQAGSGGR